MKKIINGLFIIPLSLNSSWHIEKYSKLKKNEVTFLNGSLHIKVDSSASPIIYTLEKPVKYSGFNIKGIFLGLPKFRDYSLQGKKGFDDYPLRVGFIIKGDTRPNYFQKLVFPEWLKKIYSTLPSDSGIKLVEFYNVTQNPSILNTSRIHPASSLLKENFFAVVQDASSFDYRVVFKEPLNVSAIWISVDGDDTQSQYEVVINSFSLVD